MAKKQFEARMAAIDELREAGADAAASALPKWLRHSNNYLVAKAAKVAGDLAIAALVPDLLAALDRFYTDDDPQCWAKNALVDALALLGYDQSAPYTRGLKHVQMEAVYRGRVDTAGPLRSRCAVALVDCRDLRDTGVLRILLESLHDPEKTVRVEAARAIGRIPREEAALLLRLRVLSGDPEPEVIGACFSALLSIEGAGGFAFVQRFLDKSEDVAGEAAIAIGLTHEAEAFAILEQAWEQKRRQPRFAAMLLSAMALTNLSEAIAFLIGRVEDGSTDALKALAAARLSDDDLKRTKRAAESGGPQLRGLFQEKFRAS